MKIAVFGMGYVGLVTGACLAELGFDVVCTDIDAVRVSAVAVGRAPFYEPGLPELIERNAKAGRLSATQNPAEALKGAAMTFIAVGTPTSGGTIDLTQIIAASRKIGEILGSAIVNHTIVVKSTVVPGTTDGVVARHAAEAAGIPVDQVNVAMNPEFLRQGLAVEDFMRPDRIVVGSAKPDVRQRVMALYSSFDCPKIATTSENAELIKYANNALLATAISFSNQIANICEQTANADAATVLRGVNLDRRLSVFNGKAPAAAGLTSYLQSGCGFGGSCLPKDVRALTRYAAELGVPVGMLESVLAINDGRPQELVSKARAMLGELRGRAIGVLGIAFKPGTDDLRDSPGLAVVEALIEGGVRPIVWDPYVEEQQLQRLKQVKKMSSLDDVFRSSELVILTGYFEQMKGFDWSSAIKNAACVGLIDGRGALSDVVWPAGFRYRTVGAST